MKKVPDNPTATMKLILILLLTLIGAIYLLGFTGAIIWFLVVMLYSL